MVEQLPLKELVGGSNPSGLTTKIRIFGCKHTIRVWMVKRDEKQGVYEVNASGERSRTKSLWAHHEN
jgi:hypothetical protein